MPEQLPLMFDLPMTAEEKAVWAAIETHRGRGNEILGTVLAESLGIEYKRIREVISHLVKAHHKCIGSNSSGYYVAVTPDEIAEITRGLRHRGIMILLRAASIQKTSLHDVFGQGYIEFGEGISDGH